MTTALAAAHDPPGAGVSTQPPRTATKRSRASRTSATDRVATAAEQLWSGKTRGLLEFEPIAPTEGLPMGAVGVAVVASPGSHGAPEVGGLSVHSFVLCKARKFVAGRGIKSGS